MTIPQYVFKKTAGGVLCPHAGRVAHRDPPNSQEVEGSGFSPLTNALSRIAKWRYFTAGPLLERCEPDLLSFCPFGQEATEDSSCLPMEATSSGTASKVPPQQIIQIKD